jgi:colicin import membrane protein
MNILRKSEDNPYRYGYRYVKQTDELGRPVFRMTPLTEEDILHPRLEDHVTQNEPHNDDCIYLKDACRLQLAGHPNAVVLCDHLFRWDVAGMGDHGPDVAVVLGARPGQRPSFDVAAEGVRPELIIEVTSPSTRNNDLRIKRREYWLCRVPYYAIVEEIPRRRQRRLRIHGFQYGPRYYRRLPLNAQGWLWLDTVGLWLGHVGGRVVCYDQQGQPISDRLQAEQERLRAEQRAEQETEARLRAEQERLQADHRALLAEQERLQADQRALLAEQERFQADSARLQADQRTQQAEAEVARLQEELRRLRGDT